MSISLLHSGSGAATLIGTPINLDMTVVAPTVGNVVFATTICTDLDTPVPSMTGVAWTLLASKVAVQDYTVYLWYGIVNSASSTTARIGFSGPDTGLPVTAQYAEFSGLSVSSLVDGPLSNATGPINSNTWTVSTPAFTSANGLELVLAVLTFFTASGPGLTFGALGGGFTSINTIGNTGARNLTSQFCYQVGAGPATATQVINDAISANGWGTTIITGAKGSSNPGLLVTLEADLVVLPPYAFRRIM